MYGSGTAKRQVPAVGVAERLSSKLHPGVNSGTIKAGGGEATCNKKRKFLSLLPLLSGKNLRRDNTVPLGQISSQRPSILLCVPGVNSTSNKLLTFKK